MASIHLFPVELFTRTFLYLEVPVLICAAHVCKHWRELAFACETYWNDITVASVSPTALDLAEHRLSQGGSKPLRFTIRYTEYHKTADDPVLKRVIPLLRLAVPRAWHLGVTVESMYRLYVEEALCLEAPYLRSFWLKYHAEPIPDLPHLLPLAWDRKLFLGKTGRLRTVHLHNIVLPLTPTAAFQEVDEVWFMHTLGTLQDEFPCYLFDFFPRARRLRMAGGNCAFSNAPLPAPVINLIRRLEWMDITFPLSSLPAFFEHLPLDDLEDLRVCSPDEDIIYRSLEPLLSYFHLDFLQHGPSDFILSIKGDNGGRVRRFAEPFCYYHKDAKDINVLLANREFMEQVTTLSISVTLWTRLEPWLQPTYPLVSRLIITLNEDTPLTAKLPTIVISFPRLASLVLQAANDYTVAYADADDVVAFASRVVTSGDVTLELRRTFVEGEKQRVLDHFSEVSYFPNAVRIGAPVVYVQ
ncbi:hypothetical protein AURDEDRAFT_171560 [Auricularia subglabra TFB-10046 SS5]|nr:hypothetical protein AURDEDRAFT_171560 [Auricularia subglabra TFB-10046 SS5]